MAVDTACLARLLIARLHAKQLAAAANHTRNAGRKRKFADEDSALSAHQDVRSSPFPPVLMPPL